MNSISIDNDSTHDQRRSEFLNWKVSVAQYQQPSLWRSWWQIISTIGAYALLWYLMFLSLSVSWWLTAPLAVVAGGLLIRIFIIFHDCGHGSCFKTRRANAICGYVCGFLTFTPYHRWRWEHARHHATSSNLDSRGTGDIWTLTVAEYLAAPGWKRISYRLIRNPLVLFVIGPLFLLLIQERVPSSNGNDRERQSVWWTNLAILLMVIGMVKIVGLVPYLLIQLISISVAGSIGVWLFYVQHQFEDTYWEHTEDREFIAAALQGSSFYRLPRVLQWFTGNIGFHHVHHLNPRIPNYYLERCHNSSPMLQTVKPLTPLRSLKSMSLHLWDESGKKLVGFRHLRKASEAD